MKITRRTAIFGTAGAFAAAMLPNPVVTDIYSICWPGGMCLVGFQYSDDSYTAFRTPAPQGAFPWHEQINGKSLTKQDLQRVLGPKSEWLYTKKMQPNGSPPAHKLRELRNLLKA
jgi:hypothetical protein